MPHPPGSSSARSLASVLRARVLPVLGRPLQSLPSRIILTVFGAAFVTSLAVTLVSTSSIEAFLRAKIDQKFPATLRSTAERVDLWYSQRRLDVETFGRSATVVESVARLRGEAGEQRRERAREELRKYLVYVLERFPQYEALFVLGEDGGEPLWLGETLELSTDLRGRLANVIGSQVAEFHDLRGRRAQVASAPITDARGSRLGSLHALIRIEALVPVLQDDDLGETGVIYVVDRNGETLVQSSRGAPRERYRRSPPAQDGRSRVEDYTLASGEHVVGSAVRFARFGWTIVVEEAYEEAFAPVASIIRRILAINLGIVALFGIVAYQFARSIVRPIQALSSGARRIAEGKAGVVIPLPATRDELAVLTRVFNDMSQRLQRNQLELEQSRLEVQRANERLVVQNQELHRVNEVLEQLSITDGLTKLHNHRFFHEQLRREMKRVGRSGDSLALVLFDIDDFKRLNDRHGHSGGDALLRQLAEVANGVVRETDLLARYGGEEFALIAPRTDLEGAKALGEKIRLAVSENSFVLEGGTSERISITVSVGVSCFEGDEKDFFNQADKALYRAKAAGKNCVMAERPRGQRERSSEA